MKKYECEICGSAGEHNGSVVCVEAYDALWAENQRLREALASIEKLSTGWKYGCEGNHLLLINSIASVPEGVFDPAAHAAGEQGDE